MTIQDQWRFRVGVLTHLVAFSPTKLGRTALMKLAYLLQTVKDVPLGYNSRIDTCGLLIKMFSTTSVKPRACGRSFRP